MSAIDGASITNCWVPHQAHTPNFPIKPLANSVLTRQEGLGGVQVDTWRRGTGCEVRTVIQSVVQATAREFWMFYLIPVPRSIEMYSHICVVPPPLSGVLGLPRCANHHLGLQSHGGRHTTALIETGGGDGPTKPGNRQANTIACAGANSGRGKASER